MTNITTEIPRLVTHPREQYLRKEECRIRSLALPARNADPAIAIHLNAVLGAEDLIDIHEAAAKRQASQSAPHFSEVHRRLAAVAWQLKLYHLNALASHLI